MAYATAATLVEVLPEADATVDAAALGSVLDRASALVDEMVGDSFELVGSAAARVFYGSGRHLQPVDYWSSGTPTVTMPTGWTVPAYVVRRDAVNGTVYLQTADADGRLYSPDRPGNDIDGGVATTWPLDLPITITVAWGWTAYPKDIVAATIEVAQAMWRESFAAAVPDWGSEVGRAFEIPPRAAATLNHWRARVQFGVTD